MHGLTTHPLIPKKPNLVLVTGDEGTGKTALLCGLAALASQTAKVIYVVGEGSAKNEVVPCLRAAGANMDNIIIVDCVTDESRAGWRLKDIIAFINRHYPDVRFVIIDPLSGFEETNCSMAKVRRILAPYQRAVENGVTFIFAHHVNKQGKAAGSKGWTGTIQNRWHIERASENTDLYVLQMMRGRRHPKPWPRYWYTLESSEDDPDTPVGVIGEASEVSVEDLQAQKRPNVLSPALAKAVAWWNSLTLPMDALPEEAAAWVSIGVGRGTYKDAKKIAKVLSRQKPGGGHEWYREAPTPPTPVTPIPKDGPFVVIDGGKSVDEPQGANEPACWYCPRELGLAFKEGLGIFDVDAAASADEAKRTIFAHHYITAAMDALSMDWGTPDKPTTVILNAPYDKKSDAAGHHQPLTVWIPYALGQYERGNVRKMTVVLWYKSETAAHNALVAAGARVLDIGRQRFGGSKSKSPMAFALYLLGYGDEEIESLSNALVKHKVVENVNEILYVPRAKKETV